MRQLSEATRKKFQNEMNEIMQDGRTSLREISRIRGKQKSVSVITALESLLQEETQTQAEYYIGSSLRLTKWMKTKPTREVTLFVHKLIDAYAKKVAYQATCKQGCSFCCYQQVLITEDEGLLLSELVKEQPEVLVNGESLLAQREWPANETNGKWTHPKELKRCAFLSNEGLCTVYESRPSACRNHRSVDPVYYCDEETQGHRKIRFINQIEIALILNAYCFAYPTKPLASAVTLPVFPEENPQ